MPSAVRYWRCEECDWIGPDSALLRAPNPFAPADEICGCPNCKEVNHFALACDFRACRNDASSGWPLADGSYVNRCWQHPPCDPPAAPQHGTRQADDEVR